jgi:hypothetical protein
MFCSGCGQALTPGMGVCPQCQRPVATPIPAVPGLEFELQNYAGKVRALSVVWFIWAGLSLFGGLIGMAFAHSFLAGHFGFWMHGPWGREGFPPFLGPAFLHLIWVMVIVRAGLALMAGWGLMEHAPWGRVVAIVAAFLGILRFPIGTALGIWTLVVLLGYRNGRLYDQL